MRQDRASIALKDQVVYNHRSTLAAVAAMRLPAATLELAAREEASAEEEHPFEESALAVKSVLAGVMATLLYVWPVEMAVYIFNDGFRQVVFVGVLVSAWAVFTVACWVATRLEARHWEDNLHTLPEHADPPPWR
jgi:hypothetical protein